uniref:Uncharacterized protein n=1 Tax=Rhizophora mucronata TaxID=61149 RepID=A0A2P2PJ86_RHIMU
MIWKKEGGMKSTPAISETMNIVVPILPNGNFTLEADCLCILCTQFKTKQRIARW